MKGRKMAAVLVAATMTGALAMAGCGQEQAPAGPGTSTTGPQSSETTPATRTSTELLALKDTLKSKLGSAYSDSWIEGGRLHVAVTTPEAEKTVAAAGAIPKLVTFNAAELESALKSVAAWQASLPPDQAAAIYKIIPDGRSGTVTIYVAAGQLEAISAAAAQARPAGKVPLAIRVSTGPATPL
ncbi:MULTISPECIES: hypothetical protein [unclassified Arthrobacter]|uniref:hypothetical protein n=1 Tax=unclassified Arthrobacter TaxID=235627 RepID=UPI00159DA96C|nr:MULTISPECIES: hypothetical protein [unclassified Arthrobacter]MCQ9164830.1 hypothetical protein [Arthrobacter sp. STN4]NVM98721.1 hypothetical protein [Arthrobacter sp. SDTb3-6]